MRNRPSRHLLTAIAIASALTVASPAFAQGDDNDSQVQSTDRHEIVKKKQPKPVAMFPNATRAEPPNVASSDAMAAKVNQMHTLVASSQNDEAIALGNAMLADPKANHFDKSAAWQGIGYANFGKRDFAKAAEGLQNAINENGLPNNDHYQAMFNLAKAEVAANQPDAGLATMAKLVGETKLDKPEYDSVRGYAYFGKKDYANAATVLQKSLAAEAKPDPNEQQMLFASYYELKQGDKAVALGETLVKAHPDDKTATMNLVAAYQQAGQREKAKALLGDARQRGMLTTSDDYRKLIQLYSNANGGEGETVAIINEGLQKGVLKPGADVYSVLAQDYVALNQPDKAIEAYGKADALSSDGVAELNVAKVYNNTGRASEARAAAQKAMAKGLADAGDRQAAQRLIGTGKAPPKKK